MPLALPALLCIASGFALVSAGWPRQFSLDILLRASLSVGYGLGIFSVSFFLARLCGITNLLAVDLAVFALLLAGFVLLRTRAAATVPPSPQNYDGSRWLQRALTVALAVALCAAVYSSVLRTLAHPHGEGWDAFAIWNLHARFLFRAGLHWRDGFSPLIPWSHPDYPLLLPAAIAHFWTYLGHDAPSVPAAISFLFTFSTVGLLFSALFLLRGRAPALLGTLALVSTPFFVEQGTSQYADVPLSFFFLSAIALFCLYNHDAVHPFHSRRMLVLAGLAAGFAAWTKNEGLLFLCAILAARLLILLGRQIPRDASHQPRQQGSQENWMSIAVFLVAVAPALFLTLWLKHFLAPPGDLLSDPVTAFHKLLDPARYWAIVKWYVKGFLRFGNWLLVPATLLLIGFYFAASKDEERKLSPAFHSSVLALALTLAGYFAVYLITPYDIYWHLRFSLARLFLQLWPSALFLYFLAVPCGADLPRSPVEGPLVRVLPPKIVSK